MPRFFLEVSYKGTVYNGFQSQKNTTQTIQEEIEKAFSILQREEIKMTGSSRTDAGVHALQNFFHFDYSHLHPQFAYKANAILPGDIVIVSVRQVADDAHARFDATSREYKYFIYKDKNPFLEDRAYFYPYTLDIAKMQEASGILKEYTDFTSFSKRNTQVKTFNCSIIQSGWERVGDCLVYHVQGDRFLMGMVRALTGTMLKVGRGKMSLDQFRAVIEARDCTRANFAVPAHGLFLIQVHYPATYFPL
jgi:tRNA pseudouridine38-40 synthase